MSIIGNLLGAIKAKRQEKFTSTAETYDDAVRKLAAGAEVDLDHLATLLDELDRSDSDLAADVEAKQRRIESAAELKRLATVAKQIPSKELELSKLNDEITAYVAPRKQKIQAISEELKMLRLEIDRRGYLENDLLNVGIPMALTQRRQALKLRQDELVRKQSQYADMTEQAIRNLDASKIRLSATEEKLSRATVEYDANAIRNEVEGLRKRIDTYQQQIQNWAPLKAEIEQEQAAVQSEQQAINRELMNP